MYGVWLLVAGALSGQVRERCRSIEKFNRETQNYLTLKHPSKVKYQTRRWTDPTLKMKPTQGSMWTSDGLHSVDPEAAAAKEEDLVNEHILSNEHNIGKMLLSRFEHIWNGGRFIGMRRCRVSFCTMKISWSDGNWNINSMPAPEATGVSPASGMPFHVTELANGIEYTRTYSETLRVWFNEMQEQISIYYLEMNNLRCPAGMVYCYHYKIRLTNESYPIGVIGFIHTSNEI